ncbi:DNA cytosine methyltransferase [Prauserella muralis]|uniref:DNA cytosine methyltransferase n=1 Tax=Prauserella muralis TaxID=588067 RepID=UPI0011AC7BB7|nr:DNA (cytosine-5-)-methyltransferase [Prauserella muralis]TWE23676.1 DNA (cytosine-5)-methyltransferase 1 [Prauserella muralis]
MTLLRDRFPGHLGAKPDLTFGSLCTGYGGLDLGVATAFGGGRLLWVADPDPHVSKVLAARMPDVPNLGDITTIDWQQVEPVDVLTAGFPCQDISAAGRRAGIRKGTRSGIWHQVVAAVRHLRPTLLIVENVAALRWRQGGLDIVLGDLAEVGYDAQWTSVRASDIGAPHRRERVFLLAYPAGTVVAARPVIQEGDRDGSPAEPESVRVRQAAPDTASTGRHARRMLAGVASGRGTPGEPHRHGDDLPADTGKQQPQRWRGPRRVVAAAGATPCARDQRQRNGHAPVDCGKAAADATSERHGHIRQESRGRFPSSPVPGGSPAVPHAARTVDARQAKPETEHVSWGPYAPAIRRWELTRGIAAPHPTEPGTRGRPRLSPLFVEWLMGLDPGWITSVEIPRAAQLRALGNGVVPQQAAFAVQLMLDDLLRLGVRDDEAQAA